MIVTAFSKTLRSLEQERSGAMLWWLTAALLAVVGIALWMVYARVQLDETAEEARLEIEGPAYVVQAPVMGRVAKASLTLGQYVHAGDVLVEIDSSREQLQVTQEQSHNDALRPELAALREEIAAETAGLETERGASRAAIDEAKARIQETEAPLQLAEQERARTQELSRGGLVPKRDLERAISDVARVRTVAKTSAAAVVRLETEQAKRERDREIRIASIQSRVAKLEGDQLTSGASIRVAEREVINRKIFAPISGRIGEMPVLAAGSVLQEGDRVASIVPDGGLRIVAQFAPAAAHGRIRPGESARMRLQGYPWTEFGVVECEVTATAAEEHNGKVRVELALRHSPSLKVALRHGMPGSVEVAVERISPLALLLRQAGQWVRQGKTT